MLLICTIDELGRHEEFDSVGHASYPLNRWHGHRWGMVTTPLPTLRVQIHDKEHTGVSSELSLPRFNGVQMDPVRKFCKGLHVVVNYEPGQPVPWGRRPAATAWCTLKEYQVGLKVLLGQHAASARKSHFPVMALFNLLCKYQLGEHVALATLNNHWERALDDGAPPSLIEALMLEFYFLPPPHEALPRVS